MLMGVTQMNKTTKGEAALAPRWRSFLEAVVVAVEPYMDKAVPCTLVSYLRAL